MTDRKTPKISIGIMSMTVILCVLCLTVFSVLSLSTALSERNFAEKRAQVTQEYYAAETEVTKVVNALQKASGNSRELQILIEENDITAEGEFLRFQKPIDDGQALYVELQLSEPIQIKAWQVITTAEWTPDRSLNLWSGDILMEE